MEREVLMVSETMEACPSEWLISERVPITGEGRLTFFSCFLDM
jgi:hypothetical protein